MEGTLAVCRVQVTTCLDQFQAVADAAEEAESQNAAWVRGDGGDINPGVEVPQINPLSAAVDTASTVEEALEEIALEDLDPEDLKCESTTAGGAWVAGADL